MDVKTCFDGAAFARAVADLNGIPGLGVSIMAPQGTAKLQCGTSGSSIVVIDPKVFDVPNRQVVNLIALWKDASGNFHQTRKPSDSWDTNVIISGSNDIPGVSADKSAMIAASLRNFYACESGKNSQSCVATEKTRMAAVVEEAKIKSGEYVCVEWDVGGVVIMKHGACKKYGPKPTPNSADPVQNRAMDDQWNMFNPEGLLVNPPPGLFSPGRGGHGNEWPMGVPFEFGPLK